MSQSLVNLAAYNVSIQRLLDNYLALFPEDRQRLNVLIQQLAGNGADLCDRKTVPGHLTGAALVLRVISGVTCVLLIRHKMLERWLQPGGHLESGEHPLAGASRELLEEAGLALNPHGWHAANGIPLDIDSHEIPASAAKGEPGHLHHDWLYVFEVDSAVDINLQVDEVSAFSWIPASEIMAGRYGMRLKRACERLDRMGLLANFRVDV